MDINGKVCMLDDDRMFLKIYRHFMEAKGYQVFTTDNAYKFLLYGHEIVPDVMFLDINMPRINGWEVLSKINADNRLREIPIVILSVNQDEDLAEAKGVAHFLYKPLAIEEAAELLESYCLGGKDHDLLLVEEYEPLFNGLKQKLQKQKHSCFCTHSISGAKKYLKKNKPKKICVRMSEELFNHAREELPGQEMTRVDNLQEIENIVAQIK